MPIANSTLTEPFHVSTAIASLDHASQGRAGWQVDVSSSPREARLIGAHIAGNREQLLSDVADEIEVVRRLWDSWEDNAVIRDTNTGRYVDRTGCTTSTPSPPASPSRDRRSRPGRPRANP